MFIIYKRLDWLDSYPSKTKIMNKTIHQIGLPRLTMPNSMKFKLATFLISTLGLTAPLVHALPCLNKAPADEKVLIVETFADTLGVGIHFDQGETREHLENLVDLGVRWVRDSEPWKRIETEPAVYRLPGDLPERLAFYKEHDIGVCFMMAYGNEKAYPEDPFNAEAYGRYVAEVAKMLRDSGVRYVIELWNEPHNFELGPVLGGNWHGAPPSPWLDQYMKMSHAAVEAVKAEVPEATVIVNEDVWVAHYWFAEAGLPPKLDGFSIHPYIHGPTPGPEVLHFGPEVGWAGYFTIVDEDRSLRSAIRLVAENYEEALGHKPEIWSTEWSYPIGKKLYTDGPITEEIAAAFLPRMFIISAAYGVKVNFWHTMQDMNDGPYGLIDNDLRKRSTYYAFRELSQQVGDARLVRQISGQDHPTTGLQAYLFEGSMGHTVVAWQIDEVGSISVETSSSAPLRMTSHLGEPVKFQYNNAGLPTVLLGIEPIYITGVNARSLLVEPQQ